VRKTLSYRSVGIFGLTVSSQLIIMTIFFLRFMYTANLKSLSNSL